MSVIDPGPTPPVPEPPAAVVPPTPPPAPASPWAADAATYFPDPAAQANFDRYMREKQQPYITQLEEGTKEARELWTDLQSDPDTAARDIIASVYREHPEVVAAYDAIFAAENPPPLEPVTPPPADEVPEWAKPLVEDHQTKKEREFAEKQAADYAQAKTDLQVKHSLTDKDVSLLDPFVFSAGGDMEAALVGYRAWQVAAGVAPAETPAPTPPPVLTSDGTVATPPLENKYTSYNQIGEAFRDFHARQSASLTPPPVVG